MPHDVTGARCHQGVPPGNDDVRGSWEHYTPANMESITVHNTAIFWTGLATWINIRGYIKYSIWCSLTSTSTFQRSISVELILCLFCVTLGAALIKYQAYKYFPSGLFMRSSFHTGSWQFVRVKSSCSQFYSRLFSQHGSSDCGATTGVSVNDRREEGGTNEKQTGDFVMGFVKSW